MVGQLRMLAYYTRGVPHALPLPSKHTHQLVVDARAVREEEAGARGEGVEEEELLLAAHAPVVLLAGLLLEGVPLLGSLVVWWFVGSVRSMDGLGRGSQCSVELRLTDARMDLLEGVLVREGDAIDALEGVVLRLAQPVGPRVLDRLVRLDAPRVRDVRPAVWCGLVDHV